MDGTIGVGDNLKNKTKNIHLILLHKHRTWKKIFQGRLIIPLAPSNPSLVEDE